MTVVRVVNNYLDPLISPNGVLLANTDIVFQLVDVTKRQAAALFDALDGSYVVGNPVTATTDGAAYFTVNLWPNSRGEYATCYKVTLPNTNFKPVYIQVTEGEGNLTFLAARTNMEAMTPQTETIFGALLASITQALGTATSPVTDTTNGLMTYGEHLRLANTSGNNSGTNTGDETTATIKTKLGITTLSGDNTGDETGAGIRTKLGITTLSGANTGDQDLSTLVTKATDETITGQKRFGLAPLMPNDICFWMDGVSGRPTLAAWQGSPSTTDLAPCFNAAVTAIGAGTVGSIKLPRGVFRVNSTISSTVAGVRIEGVVGDRSGGALHGTQILCYADFLVNGSDNGHAYDANDYDGPQGLYLENLSIKHNSPDTALDNGTGSYKAGSCAIRDWRGGQVVLKNVLIENFDYPFWGVQSDINEWSSVKFRYAHSGIYAGPRSDQFTIDNLEAFYCDTVLVVDGAKKLTLNTPRIIDCGTASRYAIDIRKGSVAPTINDGWFEHLLGYAGTDGAAFVGIGVNNGYNGNTTPVLGAKLFSPIITTSVAGQPYHKKYLVEIDQCYDSLISDPVFNTANGNNSQLDYLISVVGSTNGDNTSMRVIGNTAQQNNFYVNNGTGAPAIYYHTTGLSASGFASPNGRLYFYNLAAGKSFSNFYLSSEGQKQLWIRFFNDSGGNTTRLYLEKRILHGTAAPTASAWDIGDMVINSTPAAGQPRGWVCVAAGTPGTWVTFESLDTAKAPLASPTFTGTPAAPTAAADTTTTQLATTAFVIGQASATTPVVTATGGTGVVGTSKKYARSDHAHPKGDAVTVNGYGTSQSGAAVSCMVTDGNGNLGLGTTPDTWASANRAIQVGFSGAVFASTSSTATSFANNVYDNGIARYRTSNAAALYQQSGAGHYWFNAPTGTAGAALTWALALSLDSTGALAPGIDNTQTCGSAAKRWSTLYAGTGTINTSDAREKTAVQVLTDAEISAASALSKEIGTYRFLSAIAEKGEAARFHVGMTVQRAIEIIQSFGLDPLKYGFICHDEWGADADTGTAAGDRYSFRPDELLFFIARGFEARLTVLENR